MDRAAGRKHHGCCALHKSSAGQQLERTHTMHTHVPSVTDNDFAARVLESDRPAVVDFWAAWCPPCRAMHPVIEELAGERPELAFFSLDADSNRQTVIEHGVLSMPTFLVFRDGVEILRLVGSRPKRRLSTELDEALALAALAK
jgi:thioredoxin 1